MISLTALEEKDRGSLIAPLRLPMALSTLSAKSEIRKVFARDIQVFFNLLSSDLFSLTTLMLRYSPGRASPPPSTSSPTPASAASSVHSRPWSLLAAPTASSRLDSLKLVMMMFCSVTSSSTSAPWSL